MLHDYSSEFPEGLRELIICDSELGMFDEAVREQLREWRLSPVDTKVYTGS